MGKRPSWLAVVDEEGRVVLKAKKFVELIVEVSPKILKIHQRARV